MTALSERERRFVEAYMGAAGGNATEAAKAAGYSAKTARQLGARLLTKVHIRAAIDARAKDDPAVADRAERQQFLSRVMRGEFRKAPIKDRVKAAEVLGKMQGDFVKRVQLEHVPPLKVILDDRGDR